MNFTRIISYILTHYKHYGNINSTFVKVGLLYMKKFKVKRLLGYILIQILIISLTACSFINKLTDEIKDEINDYLNQPVIYTFTIDGVTYKNGFASNIMDKNHRLQSIGEPFEVEEVFYKGELSQPKKYIRIDCDHFDLIREYGVSSYYCPLDQWDEAHEYYANDDNYVYYYDIGSGHNSSTHEFAIPEIDYDKYNELMEWSENQHKYVITVTADSPSPHVKYRKVPYPDQDPKTIIRFRRDSKDGYFTAITTKYEFLIIDEKLVYNFFYTNNAIAVVDLPDDLEEYFSSLLDEQFLVDNRL